MNWWLCLVKSMPCTISSNVYSFVSAFRLQRMSNYKRLIMTPSMYHSMWNTLHVATSHLVLQVVPMCKVRYSLNECHFLFTLYIHVLQAVCSQRSIKNVAVLAFAKCPNCYMAYRVLYKLVNLILTLHCCTYSEKHKNAQNWLPFKLWIHVVASRSNGTTAMK